MKMTIDKAIMILDPETTAEALAEIEYYAGFYGQTAKVQAVSDACELAVAALREAKRTRWISVETCLPEKWQTVVIYDGDVDVAVYDNGEFQTPDIQDPEPIYNVTHWAALPAPPRGGGRGNLEKEENQK